MSSDSPAPSVAPSSDIAPSVGTLESTPPRKKRTIVVVKRSRDRRLVGSGDDGAPASPKKKIVVARRPRASEGRLFEGHATPHHHAGVANVGTGAERGGGRGREVTRGSDGHHLSSTVAGKLQWLPDGRVLDKSVLGTAAAFEEVHSAHLQLLKDLWLPRRYIDIWCVDLLLTCKSCYLNTHMIVPTTYGVYVHSMFCEKKRGAWYDAYGGVPKPSAKKSFPSGLM